MPGTPASDDATAGADGLAGAMSTGALRAYPPSAPTPLLTWPCFDPSLVQVTLTTRLGGASTGPYASLNLGLHVGDAVNAVLTNRSRVAEAIGAALDDLVFCQQVHQRAVAVVGDGDRGRGARSGGDAIPAADALVTTAPGPVLVVLVADCVPIVLHDPVAGVLACVHAGWGGTVRGIIPATLRSMRDLGSNPADIVAGIGPAIGADVYQVGDDVAGAARTAFGDATDGVLRPDGTGRFLFDLVGAAHLQLRSGGVDPANVHPSGLVTGGLVDLVLQE